MGRPEMRLHLSFVELIPGFTYDERPARSGFDKSPKNQFLRNARLDLRIVRFLMASLGAAWAYRPRCLARLGHEVHLKLNHILQSVLSTDTHHVFWCNHAISFLDF